MLPNRRVGLLILGALIFTAALGYAEEPVPPPPRRIVEPSPTDKRLATLEQRVATLEAQNAELRKMLTVSGETLTIKARDGVTIEQSKSFTVRASNEISMKAGTTATYESAGATKVKASQGTFESAAITSIRGATVQLNGNARPLPGSPTVFSD